MSRQLAHAATAGVATASAPQAVLQRKCECGARTPGGATCQRCAGKASGLQRKLMIGASNDPLEHEADRVADQVLAMPAAVTASAAPPRIQRAQTVASGVRDAPDSVDTALRESGRPLDGAVRDDMEQRFGQDFSQVRVHDGGAAARSARDVQARAYTVGSDIVFGAGQPAATSIAGARLLAHELTHVVQQRGAASGAAQPQMLRRNGDPGILDGLFDDAKKAIGGLAKSGEEMVREQLRALGTLPGTGAVFSHPRCPKNFCNPFADVNAAKVNLAATAPILLAGVGKVVSPRVVPLWGAYLFGGSGKRNLTSSFGGDFTASETTQRTAAFIHGQVVTEVTRNHKKIMPAAVPGPVTVDLTANMAKTLAAIDHQGGAHAMDFNVIGEIPGNLAGGVGKDQTKVSVGAQPSTQDDSRSARISATLTRTPGGLRVSPQVNFKVIDTIDLCPGNCGAIKEKDATIPMSRFEATKLSGDVPFEVEFPAPSAAVPDFLVAGGASAAPKKPGGPAKPKGKGKGKGGAGKKKAGGKTASVDSDPSGALASADGDAEPEGAEEMEA